MRLILISAAAMTVSTICLGAIFLSALYTPSRPAIGAWTTSITYADDRVKRSVQGNHARLLAVLYRDIGQSE
jgi:hypothetical protein